MLLTQIKRKGELLNKYQFRLTKRSIYNGTEYFLPLGQVEAENRADAEKKIHDEAMRAEFHLSASMIVKTEIMIDNQWQEIKP